MQAELSFLQGLAQRNGPELHEYARLTQTLTELWQAQVPGAEVRTVLEPALSPTCMQGQSYWKPYGYAGDYETIDRIHTLWHSTDPTLVRWDQYMHSLPATKAVRNRKDYLQSLLTHLEWSAVTPRVLNIGSGPARDVYEYLEAYGFSRVEIDCLDIDARAIEFAARLCVDYQRQVHFHQQNLLFFTPHEQYDLIWSAGVFDYLDDRLFKRVLTRLLTAVAPGGEVVIGNFNTQNVTRPYMELVCDWFLHHRDEHHLRSLALACGVDQDAVTVHQEPEGVNLFMHIKVKAGMRQPIHTVKSVIDEQNTLLHPN